MLHYLRHHRSKLDEKESIGIEPLIHQNAFKKSLHFSSYDVQSSMRHDEPDTLDLEYTRTMMAGLMFHPDPRKLGMVGLGGGSLAKFCHRHLPAAQMEVAEISKAVIALRREFHIPEDSDRLKVLHADGSKFVAQRPDSFDLLFIDGFDAKGLPERLCSQEFYDDCQAALRTHGIFVANLPIDDPRYGDCTARLRRAFAGSVLAVEDGESQNCIVFASKGAAFERYPRNVVRAPTYLDGIAMGQLRAGFALVASALEDHRC